MDIPRRKNRQHSDKLAAELLFFCFWLTRCGEVELGAYAWYGQHSTASYRRYAKELEKCGAIPRMKLRGNNTDGNNRRRFISDPPVEDFAPEMRFDWEDDHLRRLARLVCMAASVLVPDGSLEAFDNTIEDYRYYNLHYPDYHAAYEGLDPARSSVCSVTRMYDMRNGIHSFSLLERCRSFVFVILILCLASDSTHFLPEFPAQLFPSIQIDLRLIVFVVSVP